MANRSYSPSAYQAYLAGRARAQSAVQSLDPQRIDVPLAYAADGNAYRDGVADEQSGADIPFAAVTPRTVPRTPPGVAPPVTPPPDPQGGAVTTSTPPAGATSARQRIREQFKRFLVDLNKQPVEVIREVAERQLAQVEQAWKSAPQLPSALRPDYAGVRSRLDNARDNIQAGDKLKDRTDEPSRLERRRSYSRAYSVAFTEGENLAALVGSEDFLVLALGGVVVPAVKDAVTAVGNVADRAVETAGGAAKAVGSTARTAVYVIAGGSALALITYGVVRAYQRRQPQR